MVDGKEGADDVLLVDDNPGDRRFIEEALRDSPLDLVIHTVETRDEALDVVNRRGAYEDGPEPDVVLLDWNLSRETGREVVEAAKSGDASIPVLVMTGSNPEMTNVESYLSAEDMLIEKPTDPEGYIEPVRSLLTGQ